MPPLILLIFFTFYFFISAQDLFYFSKQPENIIVKSGASFELECRVSHQDSIIYYWNINNTRIGNSTRKKQIGSNLHITRADRFQDTGQYSCIAENVTSKYSITSRIANVEVIWLGPYATVQLLSPIPKNEVEKGKEIILRCIVDGNGDIRYDWFRNEEHLPKLKGKRIHIKDASPGHNGLYRCRAHNEANTVESKTNFALAIPIASYPLIKIWPKDVLIKKDGTAKFDCVFENSDETRWTYGNLLLVDDGKRYLYKNGSLIIKNVNLSDEGFYTCQGIKKSDDVNFKIQSYSAKLRLSFMEDFQSNFIEPVPSSNILIIKEGRSYELTCFPPHGAPPPKVWWEDQLRRPLSTEDTTRSVLLFESPKAETESGNYTCFAENLSGTQNMTIQLIVSVPPLVPSDMEIITLEEGDSFIFSCPFKGSPHPATTFKWKKDKKYIHHSRLTLSKVNGSLIIRQVQPSDRGSYTCEVNTTGFKPVDSRHYKLNINEKLKFIPRPISKKLELGVASKIPCRAQGTPLPLIRWVKEHTILPSHIHDINGTLHFDTVYMSDRGKYVCLATNIQGTINATINIDVIVAPRFTVKPQNPTEVIEGQSVMLHCMAEGDPIPTVKWDKNGEMNGLDSQRFQFYDNGSLLLRYVNAADKGIYGCTAGNSGGLKREEALVIVKGINDYSSSENSQADDSMMTKTVTITLSAAAAYMILVIGLMVWCRYRRRKRKEAYLSSSPENILLAKTENGDTTIPNGEKPETNDIKRENDRKSDETETTHSQSSGHSKRSSKNNQCEKFAFSRQNLSDLKLIGHGIFGQVFVARAENISSPVLVKSLQNIRSENALIEFKRETDMFYKLSHDNIVKLLGLCRDAEPHYMILEHSDWGELKHFLQTTKKERSKLSVSQIADIAKQVSLGMEHLSNARFVHKDLATRNCILNSDFKVKVSLISLSKDVYSNDYMQYRNQLISLRWQPYEAVFEDDYSTKSDVYSFAVLCWELFHQGEQPYSNLTDSAIIEKLKNCELVLKSSKNAPPKMSALLQNCASHNPKDRPTFSNIAIILGEILEDL